jgi:hypothetical protein
MREMWNSIKPGVQRLWQGLREWCGDAAYENYQRCAAKAGFGNILSPTEFYLEQLNKKYSRPNRCC